MQTELMANIFSFDVKVKLNISDSQTSLVGGKWKLLEIV